MRECVQYQAFILQSSAMKVQSCFPSELNLFEPSNIQMNILRAHTINTNAVTNSQSNYIEFIFGKSSDYYIDLASTQLNLKLQFVKSDGVSLFKQKIVTDTSGNVQESLTEDKTQPTLVANSLFSIFKSASVYLNNYLVSNSENFAYQDYMFHLLHTDKETREKNLENQLFFADTANTFNALNVTNAGYHSRLHALTNSKVVELSGRLNLDVFNLSRLLINNVQVKVVLTLADAPFYTMMPVDDETKELGQIKLSNISLSVKHYEISPSTIIAHHRQLTKSPIIYPFKRIALKTYTIAKGSFSETFENLVYGRLPSHITFAFVTNAAFSGDYKKNPFELQHFNISGLSLYRNGVLISMQALTANFKENHFAQMYSAYLEGTGCGFNEQPAPISKSDFKSGYTIFPFNLSPTPLSSECDCVESMEDGTLKLILQFAEQTPETITMLILQQFDSQIQINQNFEVGVI